MNRIDFENAPSQNSPLAAEILNLMQQNIEEAIDSQTKRHVIRTNKTDKQIINTTNVTEVTFDSAVSTTDKLTLENNKIKIGSGIRYIIVSARSALDTTDTVGFFRLHIFKNDIELTTAINSKSGNYTNITINDFLINVFENDVIKLCVDKSLGDGNINSYKDTFLQVEVVG